MRTTQNRLAIVCILILSVLFVCGTQKVHAGSPKILKFTLNGQSNKANTFKISPADTVRIEITASDSNGIGGYTKFETLSDGRTWSSETKIGDIKNITTLTGTSSFESGHEPNIGDTMRTTITVYNIIGGESKINYTTIYKKKVFQVK